MSVRTRKNHLQFHFIKKIDFILILTFRVRWASDLFLNQMVSVDEKLTVFQIAKCQIFRNSNLKTFNLNGKGESFIYFKQC